MTDLDRSAETVIAIAWEAADVVMRVYATSFAVELKGVDDPVTLADREANTLICNRLSRAFPGVPVVAEESDPQTYAGFSRAERAFFVDPLDGTREFVDRNGEFAVMIGLAEGGRAKLGVIVAPAWARGFVGIAGEGAWEVAPDGSRTPIRASSRTSVKDARVVLSRSRRPSALAERLSSIGTAEPVSHGSSGLKGVLVATGEQDAYVQPGPAGMRWDACATDALVRAAGGELSDVYGAPIDYAVEDLVNRGGMVATNGLLHAAIVAALPKP